MRLLTHAQVAFLCASGLAGWCASFVSADWTRFRGDNGGGVVKGDFAESISQADFDWTIDLPGAGHSSPVVYQNRLYITSSDAEAGERYVLCIDPASGKELWKKVFAFDEFKQHADNSFSSATPAVDDAGVYVTWADPQHYKLLCLDRETGEEKWSADLGSFKSQQGQGSSPIGVDDLVILANDQEGPQSAITAFDHKTGAVRWTLERDSSDKTAMSTPVVYAPGGRPAQVIFTSKSRGLTAIDPKTGTVVWEAPKAFDARTVGSPVTAGDLVIGACGEGASLRELMAFRPGDAGEEPTQVYKIERIAPYVPTPLAVDDRLYLWGDAGVVSCVNAQTGKQIWSDRVGGMYYGSPVCVGKTIWCMGRKGELVGIAAGDTFKIVTKMDLGQPSHATPAVAGTKMYLRTVSKLICVDVAKK